jgi:hypothetical protein
VPVIGGDFTSICYPRLLHKVVKSFVEAAPGTAERPPFDHIIWEREIQRTPSRSEHSAIGFGEKHSHATTYAGQTVGVSTGELGNQSFTLKSS